MTDPSSTSFSTEQFDKIYPPGVERHYWNRCRNRVIARELRLSGASGPVLEIGCGKGLVVRYLRAQGVDLTGIELAPVEALPDMVAHVRTGADVMDLDPALAAKVRTVLLLDVIEHIEDPKGFLQAIRTKLPALTHVLVTVPARQELFSNFDRFNGHFRRYDPTTIKAHLCPTGKETLAWSYAFHSLYPAAKMLLASTGKRKQGFTVPHGLVANMVHASLGIFLYLEYLVLPKRWKGTSIIAVART